MTERSKEDKEKSTALIRKAIYAPGKVPGTFEEEALEPELNEDVLCLAYQHELDDGQIQKISLKFEGFGFTGKMAEIEKNPLHDEFCELMKDLVKKIWEFDE